VWEGNTVAGKKEKSDHRDFPQAQMYWLKSLSDTYAIRRRQKSEPPVSGEEKAKSDHR
jgi:hypothetical protein